MTESSNAPIFADRYEFRPVDSDWDTGRSGYTHLVYDIAENRFGVLKRAEISSISAVEGLKNEAQALRELKAFGVPELYDTGETVYGSKTYFYLVMEYIDGMRVEKKIDKLEISERVEILTQLFELLTTAHAKGIANGDVDLKHLFWQEDSEKPNKKKLIAIDWGNAKLGIDPNRKEEFAFDLARSGEIIYSLVTQQGKPPARGPIALPDCDALISGLDTLPDEYYELCKWAPRAPRDGESTHTAAELHVASKEWLHQHQKRKKIKLPSLVAYGFLVILGIGFAFWGIKGFMKWKSTSVLEIVSTVEKSPSPSPSIPNVGDEIPPTIIQTEIPLTPIDSTSQNTFTPVIIHPTGENAPIIIFDEKLTQQCWESETSSDFELKEREGFYRSFNRGVEEKWWNFSTGQERTIEHPIRTLFTPCFNKKPIRALALNAWISRIEPQKGDNPGSEFGFFLEDQNGRKREYTFWVDKKDRMFIRIRDENIDKQDYEILGSKVHYGLGEYGTYAHFLIRIFFEIDNDGVDILYLLEGTNQFVGLEGIKPEHMMRNEKTIRPTLGEIDNIGLIGYGGRTDVLIWILAFLGM